VIIENLLRFRVVFLLLLRLIPNIRYEFGMVQTNVAGLTTFEAALVVCISET
jgi:hypothetical protein